jgi:hypothetical protein
MADLRKDANEIGEHSLSGTLGAALQERSIIAVRAQREVERLEAERGRVARLNILLPSPAKKAKGPLKD